MNMKLIRLGVPIAFALLALGLLVLVLGLWPAARVQASPPVVEYSADCAGGVGDADSSRPVDDLWLAAHAVIIILLASAFIPRWRRRRTKR